MQINDIPIDNINKTDLQVLIDNKVVENRKIEYKRSLPKFDQIPQEKIDEQKIEFLADISSFANANGGDIIYGIKTINGIPSELVGIGVSAEKIDNLKLQLQQIIRTGIQPRIFNVDIQEIPLPPSDFILIIRVPKSIQSPHMVSYNIKGYERFFSRNSNGKQPLDVLELKTSFLLSGSRLEQIKNFRINRLNQIMASDTPINLYENTPRIVLHIIPLNAFDIIENIDLSQIQKNINDFQQIFSYSYRFRYNFDGYIFHNGESTYTQIYRNGIIEIVRAYYPSEASSPKILGLDYEHIILKFLYDSHLIQTKLNIQPPIFIMLSLLGVKGYSIYKDMYHDNIRIEKTNLIMPEIENDSLGYDESVIMKPIFDIVWNAVNIESSQNYDKDGKWKGGDYKKLSF